MQIRVKGSSWRNVMAVKQALSLEAAVILGRVSQKWSQNQAGQGVIMPRQQTAKNGQGNQQRSYPSDQVL